MNQEDKLIPFDKITSFEDLEIYLYNESIKKNEEQNEIKKNEQNETREINVVPENNVIKGKTKIDFSKKAHSKKVNLNKTMSQTEIEKVDKRLEKKRTRKIARMSKQIEKNLSKNVRFTEPKKRNLLSRIVLQSRLARGHFDYVENEYDFYSQKEINKSKNASKRRDKSLYKQVQAYEDAKDDVTLRKGWNAFKIGLGAALLAGLIAVVNNSKAELQNNPNQIVSFNDMNDAEKDSVYDMVDKIKNDIIEKDGYHFDNITDEEFADGYLKLKNYEKKLSKNTFNHAFLGYANDDDQKLLSKIVEESFKDDYESLTEEQKRDYKQLAFNLLPYSLPDLFSESNMYIRNPIVYDELTIRKSLRSKGYYVKLKVNSDEEDTVRNLGNLMHTIKELNEDDYTAINKDYSKQEKFYDNILQSTIGDEYSNLNKNDKRDYIQIVYEWLPDDAKEHIVDPIELEKNSEEFEK